MPRMRLGAESEEPESGSPSWRAFWQEQGFPLGQNDNLYRKTQEYATICYRPGVREIPLLM